MRSRQARTTHTLLRTLVRPYVGVLPLRAQRYMIERILHNAEPPRKVRIEPVTAGMVKGELIVPDGVQSERVLYYLHGGGYILGSLKTHRHFVARLAKKLRMRALHIDYRLAPEHPHPAALDDALAAYDWLLGQGFAAGNVVIGGESAGGGLTLATLLALRDRGAALPGLAFVISPWVDLTMGGGSVRTRRKADPMIPADFLHVAARHYRGAHAAHAPLVSPLFGDLRGLPPLLVHAGDNEVLLDDALRLHARCRENDVEAELKIYDDLFHAFHLFGHIPEAREAVQAIAAFVEARTAPHRPSLRNTGKR